MNSQIVVTSVEHCGEFTLFPGSEQSAKYAKARHGLDSPIRKIYLISGYTDGHFEPILFYKGSYYHLFNNKHLDKPCSLIVAHGNKDNLSLSQVDNATCLTVLNPKEEGPKKIRIRTSRKDVIFNDAWAWKHSEEPVDSNNSLMIPFCGEAYELSGMEISRLSKQLRDANDMKWLEQSKTVSLDSLPKP